jgi:hypothetical protein
MKTRILCGVGALIWVISPMLGSTQSSKLEYEVRQLPFRPAHHFYGYIGHVGNSPYSADGKYLVALRTPCQDRMPGPVAAGGIVLLYAQKN